MCYLDILSIQLYIYNNFANLKSVSSEIRWDIPTTFRRKSKPRRNISMGFRRTSNPYRNPKIIMFYRNFVGYFRRPYIHEIICFVGISSKKTDENIVCRNVRQNVACFLVVLHILLHRGKFLYHQTFSGLSPLNHIIKRHIQRVRHLQLLNLENTIKINKSSTKFMAHIYIYI